MLCFLISWIKFSDKAPMLRQIQIILLVPLLVLPGLIPGDLPLIFSGAAYQTFSESDEDEDKPCLELFTERYFHCHPVLFPAYSYSRNSAQKQTPRKQYSDQGPSLLNLIFLETDKSNSGEEKNSLRLDKWVDPPFGKGLPGASAQAESRI